MVSEAHVLEQDADVAMVVLLAVSTASGAALTLEADVEPVEGGGDDGDEVAEPRSRLHTQHRFPFRFGRAGLDFHRPWFRFIPPLFFQDLAGTLPVEFACFPSAWHALPGCRKAVGISQRAPLVA